MKKIHFIAAAIFTALSFTSCKEDDAAPMVWEFSSYDKKAVSAVYAPDFVNQVAIAANDNYTGEITLTCTNYSSLSIDTYTNDGVFVNEEAGFTITKTDGRTLKIVFTPVSNVGKDGIYVNIFVSGNDNKERNITNMSIGRIHEKK